MHAGDTGVERRARLAASRLYLVFPEVGDPSARGDPSAGADPSAGLERFKRTANRAPSVSSNG